MRPMLVTLFLISTACSEAPPPAAPPPAAPEPAAVPTEAPVVEVAPAAWVGDWVKDDKILATNPEGEVKLMQGGEVVMSGPMEGHGLERTAPLDGCGAKLSLSGVGGDITLALDGPECPVEFAGTYVNTVSP